MKQFIQHLQIKHKLIIIIMSTVIFTLLLVTSALVIGERYTTRQSMADKLLTVSKIIADRSTAALSFDDQTVAIEVLTALDHEPSVILGCIYDDSRSLFAMHTRPPVHAYKSEPPQPASASTTLFASCPSAPQQDGYRFWEKNFELYQSIMLEGELIGIVYIRATLDRLNERLMQFILLVMSMISFAGVVAYFLASKQQAIISRPILDLANFARKISIKADYTERLPPGPNDEIGTLNRSFNDMLEQIHKRQLARDIAEQALSEREQDLVVTLNSIGDAVIVTNINGQITRMNPVAEQLTGWSFEDAREQSLKTVFPIVDASTGKPIDNPVEKVISTGETVFLSNHTTLIAKDGSQLQIADSAAPIRNRENNILGLILVFNDVTEQYHLREAAAKSERNLQSIMDNSPAAIHVIDAQGYFTFINQQFENLFHLRHEEVAGKRLSDILPLSIAQEIQNNDATVLSTEQSLETEEVFHQSDGMHTYASTRFPLFNEDNDVYAVCSITTDITEKRQQEEQLRRSQKMDALGKLTGGIAHDYNNLLGIIMGYAEVLNDRLEHNPGLRKYVLDIERAARRGSKLTQKLLSFTRHKSSDANILDINCLLLEQKLMLEKTLTARISLVFDLSNELWPVWLDSGDLEDAIINISINASHAISSNGQLTFRTHNEHLNSMDAQLQHLPAGDYVLLSITDNGKGMNEKTREQIFDPFFSTKGEQGTGLGLSQVYGFVKRSGGEIKVHSEAGKGSRFALYFPRSHEPDINTQTETNIRKSDLRGSETLLVVDDEPTLVELAEEILSAQGYRVLCAHNGEQALTLLKKNHVDLMLSDVIMPIMDGYQLADQVQKRYPHIKIQMTSGFADDRHNLMPDNTLHQNLLYKPYASNTLLVHVRSLLDTPLTKTAQSGETLNPLNRDRKIKTEPLTVAPRLNTESSSENRLAGRTILIMDDEADVRDLFELALTKLGCNTILTSNSDETIAHYQRALHNRTPVDAVILDLSVPGSIGGAEVAAKIRALHAEAIIIVSSGDSTGSEMAHFQDYGFDGALEKTFNRKKIQQLLERILK
ncbi:diguanylate cyclase/phosphodiesterase (GGDEF & EAL domains) with PAS/PAC sensor(s) [hydrothermal vent metagenome]|uniref:histidine kinase n=1 Tax=hydrothermal vent metagenome TaxID=652676 RepID=A0A3B0XBB6_9ZZZZ